MLGHSADERGQFADSVKRRGEYTVGTEYSIPAGQKIRIYELSINSHAAGCLVGSVRARCEISEYDYTELRSLESFQVDIEGKKIDFEEDKLFKIMKN